MDLLCCACLANHMTQSPPNFEGQPTIQAWIGKEKGNICDF